MRVHIERSRILQPGSCKGMLMMRTGTQAAYTYGVTNGINAVADGMCLPLDFSATPVRKPLLRLVEPAQASHDVRHVY